MGQLRRDGVALAYEEAGSGAPPIVLVHDLASDHTCFAHQFKHFSRRHRVVVVDLRGHGQSDKPRQDYSVAVLADDLAWLCYELGLYRPVVLGHGLGGMVALDLAARYQDLPAAIVAVAPEAASPAMLAMTRLTLPRYVAAPLLESISSWDHVAAGSAVPVLRVAAGTGEVMLDSRGEADPSLASVSSHLRPRGGTVLPEELASLLEELLSELSGRAPP